MDSIRNRVGFGLLLAGTFVVACGGSVTGEGTGTGGTGTGGTGTGGTGTGGTGTGGTSSGGTSSGGTSSGGTSSGGTSSGGTGTGGTSTGGTGTGGTSTGGTSTGGTAAGGNTGGFAGYDFTCGRVPVRTSVGACLGQEDALARESYGLNRNQGIDDLIRDCAKGPCLSVTDPRENIACVNDCAQEQLTMATGQSPITKECSVCYAAVANCAKDNCISHCLVDTGQCAPCQCACGCIDEFQRCTGLPSDSCR